MRAIGGGNQTQNVNQAQNVVVNVTALPAVPAPIATPELQGTTEQAYRK